MNESGQLPSKEPTMIFAHHFITLSYFSLFASLAFSLFPSVPKHTHTQSNTLMFLRTDTHTHKHTSRKLEVKTKNMSLTRRSEKINHSEPNNRFQGRRLYRKYQPVFEPPGISWFVTTWSLAALTTRSPEVLLSGQEAVWPFAFSIIHFTITSVVKNNFERPPPPPPLCGHEAHRKWFQSLGKDY